MLYRYKITPRSPVITPFMSDTFFGHFCWALKYKSGSQFLTDFLNSFGNDKTAPVLFSSAVISGYIPCPSLPGPSRERIKNIVEKHYGHKKTKIIDGMKHIKKISKIPYISIKNWIKLKSSYSNEKLYELLIKEMLQDRQEISKAAIVKEVCAGNVINRISGSVPEEGGGLFYREKTWFKEGVTLDLYVEINEPTMKANVDWFLTEYLSFSGFGADKSVGMGQVDIESDIDFNMKDFDVEDANAHCTLSLCAFPGMEQIASFYKLTTKFGKLGGSFAVNSPEGGNPKPFKKPIMMYEPGAVFFTPEPLNRRPLIDDVHTDKRIRHCGIPITLPFKIEGNKTYATQAV